MIVSQPALLSLSSLWNNLTGRESVAENHAEAVPKPAAPPQAALARTAAIRDERLKQAMQAVAVAAEQPEPIREEVVVQAATREERSTVRETPAAAARPGPLTANETRARAAALRALAFSRARRFDAAQAAFEDAARLDPELDLTRVPSFWSLERAAHEAAIAAYVAAGRSGDAAVLRAKVQSVYRPKPLRPRNAAATV
jgi:hypothetical protein